MRPDGGTHRADRHLLDVIFPEVHGVADVLAEKGVGEAGEAHEGGQGEVDAARSCHLLGEEVAPVLRTARLAHQNDAAVLGGDDGLDCEHGADTRSDARDAAAATQVLEGVEKGDHVRVTLAALELVDYLTDALALVRKPEGKVHEDMLGRARGAGVDDAHPAAEGRGGGDGAFVGARELGRERDRYDVVARPHGLAKCLPKRIGGHLARHGEVVGLHEHLVEPLVREVDAVLVDDVTKGYSKRKDDESVSVGALVVRAGVADDADAHYSSPSFSTMSWRFSRIVNSARRMAARSDSEMPLEAASTTSLMD